MGRPKRQPVADLAAEYRRSTDGRDPERDARCGLWGAAIVHLAKWRRRAIREGINATRERHPIPLVPIDPWCVAVLREAFYHRRLFLAYLAHPQILGPAAVDGALHAAGIATRKDAFAAPAKKVNPKSKRWVRALTQAGQILQLEKHRHGEQLLFYLNVRLLYLGDGVDEPTPQQLAVLAAFAGLGGDDRKVREYVRRTVEETSVGRRVREDAPREGLSLPVGEYIPVVSDKRWRDRIRGWTRAGYVDAADLDFAIACLQAAEIMGRSCRNSRRSPSKKRAATP